MECMEYENKQLIMKKIILFISIVSMFLSCKKQVMPDGIPSLSEMQNWKITTDSIINYDWHNDTIYCSTNIPVKYIEKVGFTDTDHEYYSTVELNGNRFKLRTYGDAYTYEAYVSIKKWGIVYEKNQKSLQNFQGLL
eukprot:TRINITY_DN26458_c0_g1_i1.p2 TRINITY_DN26458_c0_g1~~TRINITY_DN26458_c0_g1_i1.p2  ORF type:complete len:137 (+),score=18.52 TRINITY_DN26458_c0_g1_i1:274-684(+)